MAGKVNVSGMNIISSPGLDLVSGINNLDAGNYLTHFE
jgi:hypothetical protein